MKQVAGDWEEDPFYYNDDKEARFVGGCYGKAVSVAYSDGRWRVRRVDGKVEAQGVEHERESSVLDCVVTAFAAARIAADTWAKDHGDELDWELPCV